MTTEEQLSKVEKEVKDLNGKVDTILTLVQKMDVGLYGDEKNKHTGVIEKQEVLEQEVKELKAQIEAIHKKSNDQDIAIRTKSSTKSEWIDYAKEIGRWIVNGIILYLILKGTMSPDALLQH